MLRNLHADITGQSCHGLRAMNSGIGSSSSSSSSSGGGGKNRHSSIMGRPTNSRCAANNRNVDIRSHRKAEKTFLRLRSFALVHFLVLALLHLHMSAALTVEVEPQSSECFVLDLQRRSASFSGNYEVLTDLADDDEYLEANSGAAVESKKSKKGGSNPLDSVLVTVEGPAPRKQMHYESKGLGEGSFTVEAQQRGDHSLCFKNDLESGDAITIGFAFRADGDVEMAAALERNGEQPDGVAARSASSSSPLNRELATEANVKSMIEVANELTQGLDMLADHQEFMRVREEMHRKTVVSTNGKVMWWSVVEAVILSGMSLWQILYIRKYFETRRMI